MTTPQKILALIEVAALALLALGIAWYRRDRQVDRLVVEPAAEEPWWKPEPAVEAAVPAGRTTERQLAVWVPLKSRPASARSHDGATEDWSPTDELRQITSGKFTPTEVLPSHIVRSEVRVPDLAALEADVSAAFAGWDEALAPHFAAIDRVIAAAQTAAGYRVWRGELRTQLLPMIERRELIAA